ncbi:hypothetical protein BD311DRAFT_810469 [Dichomitus squalens]|uniref:BTB domain-containing protein n=1 Tax=Dichomitus squalens TaxID=114155 RepID=A0A4Q9M9E5_9APHY|nr:hypothetical protein BD311DRAFT_810469 [Dichomitus squalens]
MSYSDGARPPKRTRAEVENESDLDSVSQRQGNEDSAQSGVKRDEEFWFHDGSVVIRAGETAFRLFKGLLAAQSPVLHDLFSAPNFAPDEYIDGVPVVRVFDAPEDWRYLLRILVPKGEMIMLETIRSLKDFPLVSALIRLAHKYQIGSLEQRAIEALKRMYPNTFESFVQVQSEVYPADANNARQLASNPPVLATYAISATNLARLTNTTSVLPAALYHCVCLGGAVVRGLVREGGPVEFLSEADLAICINATSLLTCASAEYVDSMQCSLSYTCGTPHVCGRIWNETMKKLKEEWQLRLGSHALRGSAHDYRELCTSCLVLAQKRDLAERRQVWQRLPKLLDIADVVGPWPVKKRL